MVESPRKSGSLPQDDEPLFLGHLMACAPRGSRKATVGSLTLSVLGHVALLTLAFYITSSPSSGRVAPPPTVDITLPPDPAPEPPPLPPPPPVSPGSAGPAVPGGPGFPELEPPPVETPIGLPPIHSGPATVDPGEAIGVPGGTPGGTDTRHVTGDDVEVAPVFVRTTVNPELKNRDAVARALARAYPAMLREAGMGGRVLVWVLVDESGGVMKTLVKQSSGVPGLDEAALGVARTMRFSPGLNHDTAVKVWVAVPVEFRVDR